jgi:protein-S-isoprenylcysteine O-methyltransferase Ste14
MGSKFWAGVLVGVGIGLLVAAVLVEQELMTLQRKAWVSVTGIVLAVIGQTIAWRVVRRSQQRDKNKPQNA